MKEVKKTFGLAVLFKIAGIKLPEENGKFKLLGQKRVERKVQAVIKRLNIRMRR